MDLANILDTPDLLSKTILPVFYILLSTYITVHVLRNKSDPRASLLWIALVWFAPVIGAILYLMFGINRIRRRARRLGIVDETLQNKCELCALNDDGDRYWGAFCHLGCTTTGAPQLEGNAIDILTDVDAIHNEMIDAINAAEHNIYLTTFIFKYDDLGKRVVGALTKAKDRGVDIYISLDGFGNGLLRSRAYRVLRRAGINTHRFLHSYWPWRMPYMNLRNHRKLLIIDERLAFTGSLNIGRVGNLETHFKIRGPIIAHMISAFKEDWSLSTSHKMLSETNAFTPALSGQVKARGIKSGPAYSLARTRTMLSGALGVATRRVRIVTPYFVPDKSMLSDLELASLRGVQVELILPAKSNYFMVDWAARRQLKTLLQTGCMVYLRDDRFDHSKLMVVDDRWVLIGSTNWDSRSLRLNFEFDIECIGNEFAAQINELIDEKRAAGHFLNLETYMNRGPFEELRDSAARLLLPYL